MNIKTIRSILAAVWVIAASAVASAAALTPSQVTTLKTLCSTDQACTAFATSADDVGLAAWFNTPDAAYIVWRTSVSLREVQEDAAFDWTRVDNLSVGKACIWDSMFAFNNINPAQPNVRAGIDAAWVGTAADLAVRAAVYAKCKRAATRAEKALASGAGTNPSPSIMTFEGTISYADASQIRS